jgi:hypothetical protein
LNTEGIKSKALNLELTKNFMKLCEIILLSENVKFSIEKAKVLPSELYQAKYDLDLIVELTKNLFPFNLFESVTFLD